MAEVVEHLLHAEKCRQGIHDSLERDVRRGTVPGFEHRRVPARGIEVGAWRQAHAADDHGGDVSENVAEQVGGDDDVEAFGAADEVHGGGIDEKGFGGDVRKVGGDGGERLIPEHQRVALRVGFRNAGDFTFAVAFAG